LLPLSAPLPNSSRLVGIEIEESDEQSENADSPIPERLELDSNVIVERERHRQKHDSPILSTLEGMQIEESDEQSQNA
jgi:hypothetical protein